MATINWPTTQDAAPKSNWRNDTSHSDGTTDGSDAAEGTHALEHNKLALFMAYANGRIPQSALASVPGSPGEYLLKGAVHDSFVAMRAAAARDGVTLKVADGYRPIARQRYWRNWWCGRGMYAGTGCKLGPYPLPSTTTCLYWIWRTEYMVCAEGHRVEVEIGEIE